MFLLFSMTGLVKAIFFFSLLSNSHILPVVQTIDPEPLRAVIKKTLSLEKVDKKECIKVILYNSVTERYVLNKTSGAEWYSTKNDEFIPINIDVGYPNNHNFMSFELLEKVHVKTNETIQKAIGKRILHCFLLLSLVNTTQQAKEMERMNGTEMQEKKLQLSLEITKLLQFKSPVYQRTLVLVRFGERSEEFGNCRKTIYQKYPRRLVPLWEQVLLDFFPITVAVHAVSNDKVVQTRREEGNLLWMCDDIIERIQAEESCVNNTTTTCKDKMDNGEFSAVTFNMSTCKGYTPRM